ncbi:hypothetical protein Sjap_016826 [Stephania japonica]|uniref:Electron transporter n=1 Tax=Stephania japonica TaxID=461633 RepID=A0AAP0I529_9MAGN
MLEMKCQKPSLEPLKSARRGSRHSRSMSDPHKRVELDGLQVSPVSSNRGKKDLEAMEGVIELKKQFSNNKLESSLKQEILQLEKRLQEQFMVRMALEKALGYGLSSHDAYNESPEPKNQPAKQLIRDIAVLELEVVYLEQHLLSLYRKAFEQQISLVSPTMKNGKIKASPCMPRGEPVEVANDTKTKNGPSVDFNQLQVPRHSILYPLKESDTCGVAEKLLDSGIYRTDSSLSQRSAYYPTRSSPPMKSEANDARLYFSQPLSFMESSTSSVTSLAEHLGTRIADHVPETPNRITEDMVKCMSTIYCKISDPPLVHHEISYSPISSFSSPSAFSPEEQFDMWSAQCQKVSPSDAKLYNPFHVEGLKEFSGPYSMMVEIPSICREKHMMNGIDDRLKIYKSLVCRLKDVDPKKMKHEEKLAFWINIYNALALLVYGIPQSSAKRMSLILKAAYNVGGHTISADMIQSSILGCRTPRPGQVDLSLSNLYNFLMWLWMFFSSRTKFRAGDERLAYCITQPEPLLHFALCSGSHSDPAVRVYTPKRVFQELELAKEEYIQATLGIRNDQKLLMPKLIESFAKDSGLSSFGVVEMIQHFAPKSVGDTMQRYLQGKSRKIVEWAPHNFAFRYLLSNDLVK